jgi:hypothetical protein
MGNAQPPIANELTMMMILRNTRRANHINRLMSKFR